MPEAPWFALLGGAGRDSAPFLIGADLELSPASSGRLFCFSNDVPRMYWNNGGSLLLTVIALG